MLNFIILSLLSLVSIYNSFYLDKVNYKFSKEICFKSSILAIGEIHRLEINNDIEFNLINNFIAENGSDINIFIEYPPSLYLFIDSFVKSNDSQFLKSYFTNWENNNYTNYHQRQYEFIKKLVELKKNNKNIELICTDIDLNRRNTFYTLNHLYNSIDKARVFDSLTNQLTYSRFNNLKNKDSVIIELKYKFQKYNLEHNITNNYITNILESIQPISNFSKRDSIMFKSILTNLDSEFKKSIYIAGASHVIETYDIKKLKTSPSVIYLLKNSKLFKKNSDEILTVSINTKNEVISNKRTKNIYYYPYSQKQKKKIDSITTNKHYSIINSNKLFHRKISHYDYLILVDSSEIIL